VHVVDCAGNFYEFDIQKRKETGGYVGYFTNFVKNYSTSDENIGFVDRILVTNDNEYLFTVTLGGSQLRKWQMKDKKLL